MESYRADSVPQTLTLAEHKQAIFTKEDIVVCGNNAAWNHQPYIQHHTEVLHLRAFIQFYQYILGRTLLEIQYP